MTNDEVKSVMRLLAGAYPSLASRWNDNPSAAFTSWHVGIGDLPMMLVEEAVNAWIRTNKYAPTIAEIREAVATRVYKLPTLGSALAKAKGFVRSGERGSCPMVIMYTLDRIGRPKQVAALSDFAFEKAFQEAWNQVVVEAQTHILDNLTAIAEAHMRGDRVLPVQNQRLALTPGTSQLPRMEEG